MQVTRGIFHGIPVESVALLVAGPREATVILTVTSGLRLTRARHVYNRDAENRNRNFVLQLRTIRMQKMCQSQQFVIWDPSFCHPSVTPAQTFAGRKLKTRRSSMMLFFHLPSLRSNHGRPHTEACKGHPRCDLIGEEKKFLELNAR